MKPYRIKILKPGSINANLPKEDSSWTVEQVGDTKLYRLGDGYIIESGTDFRWRFQNPGFQANGQEIRTASNRLVPDGPFYQSGTQILATDTSGTTKSLHEAAEMVYATKHIFDTNKKLYNASKLNHQRKVVLFGHYGAKKGIQLVFPSGFVFGHPYSHKIYGRIDGGAVLGRSYASTEARVLILGSDNEHAIGNRLLDQHRFTIHSSLDWCVYRPEKKVGGLIFCTMCHNLATRNSFDFRYVFTRGLICGPCRDHLEENFKCPAFFWENL